MKGERRLKRRSNKRRRIRGRRLSLRRRDTFRELKINTSRSRCSRDRNRRNLAYHLPINNSDN